MPHEHKEIVDGQSSRLDHLNTVEHPTHWPGHRRVFGHKSASLLLVTEIPDPGRQDAQQPDRPLARRVGRFAKKNPLRPKNKNLGLVATMGGKAQPGETVVETALREVAEEVPIPGFADYVLARLEDSQCPSTLVPNNNWLTTQLEQLPKAYYAPLIVVRVPYDDYLAAVVEEMNKWYAELSDESRNSDAIEMSALVFLDLDNMFDYCDARGPVDHEKLFEFVTTKSREEQQAAYDSGTHPNGYVQIYRDECMRVKTHDDADEFMESFVGRTMLGGLARILDMFSCAHETKAET